MKTLDTIAGKMYVVMSPNGGTVTSADGLISETVEAGKQKIIIGTGAQIQLDDAAGKIVATFNSAPAKLRLLGLLGGGESAFKKLTLEEALALANLPAGGGKMSVSLPWEAQLLITGVPDALQAAADNGWTITVQYREPEADSELYNKYAACTTVAEVHAVNADYKNDLTADGTWIYPLPALTNGNEMFRASGLKHMVLNAPVLAHCLRFLNDCGRLLTVEAYIPKLVLRGSVHSNGMFICGSYNLEKCIITDVSREITSLIYFAAGCSKLTEFSIPELPKLSSIGNGFEGTQLNKASAIRLIGQLPTWQDGEHAATIGIHVDCKQDEEVLAVITNAESKRWTLTVQWNGKATAASTFGLRKPPIYAKLVEFEGVQYLDWGHYVTDWEANGYMEFASVEDANAYFGIQEELLTEYNANE